ncbi:transcription factor A, mitochondrial-like [Panulirus ornatus]|uniref:transcription factor A, mitochondrial-like n=1 Tax=Panulirus ornatus TaxID=150431 RepID=UPI003A874C7A
MSLSRMFFAKCSVSRGLFVGCTEFPRLTSLAYKKTIAEELGLPEPPKRPLTPYIRFLMEHQVELKGKYLDMPYKEMNRKILHLWQNLSFDEKNQWSLAYVKDKAEYDVKYTSYMKMLSPEQIKCIQDLKIKRSKEKLERREQRMQDLEEKKKRFEERLKKHQRIQKKKDCKDLGKPKPPSPAFTLFLRSVNQEKGPLKKILREAANRWHNLPEETKALYFQKAKKLQEQYQRDLSDWEDKMFKAGRLDLIRTGQQVELSKTLRN